MTQQLILNETMINLARQLKASEYDLYFMDVLVLKDKFVYSSRILFDIKTHIENNHLKEYSEIKYDPS